MKKKKSKEILLTRIQLRQQIEKHCKVIAEHRDALVDLISDITELISYSEYAVQHLEDAVELLSRNL